MQLTSRSLISGNVAVAALAAVAGFIIVGCFVSESESGQGNFHPVHVSRFGPETIGRSGTQGQRRSEHIAVDLLLPSAKQVLQPFRLEVLNDDTKFQVPVPAGENGRASLFFDVFITGDTDGNGHDTRVIHVKNEATGEDRTTTSGFSTVTVRVLPAVLDTGETLSPVSSSAVAKGYTDIKLANGGVTRLPFEDALPPVQDELAG